MPRVALVLIFLVLAPWPVAPARAAAPEPLAPVGPAFVALAGTTVLFVSPTTGAVRTAERLVLSPDGPVTALAASPDRIAVAAGAVLAGGPLGPFASLPAARAVAVADGAVLSAEGERIVVRDPAPRELVRVPGLAGPLRAAGPYVAFLARRGESFALTVLDRGSGAAVLRLALPREPDDFDVQADGKVVVAVPRTRAATAVSWGQAGRRGLRDLAGAERRTQVRIAGDRVAFARPATGEAGGSELAISDLDGFTEPVSFPVAGVVATDFDGERVAWSTPECVYVADASDPAPGLSPPPGPCRRVAAELVAPETVGLAPRRRSFATEVACPMATESGCRGELRASFRRRGVAVRLGQARVALRRGERRRVTIRVTGRTLMALRGRTADRLELRLLVAGGGQRTAQARLTAPRRAPLSVPPRSSPEDGPGGEFVIGG